MIDAGTLTWAKLWEVDAQKYGKECNIVVVCVTAVIR